MKKFFRMYLALAFLMLGAMSTFAGERISLQEVPFCTWDGWGADAQATGDAECEWVIGESTGQPYGNSTVIPYADLSNFSKLIVVATDGKPRFLLNRDIDEGKANATESEAHLIDNTVSGWSDKYFSQEAGENEGETIYYVDLKQIVKDKGFAHLHAIKGANWANVTIVSMEVERQGKAQQIGWTSIINNSNMEGEDASSFFTKVNTGDNADKVLNSEITDGVGVDGSRGILVAAGAKTANAWDNQFWFRFNEDVPAGTKYRVSFDYRADTEATVSTQAHAEPSDYIHYEMFGNLSFSQDWQTFATEGEVTEAQSKADKQFRSVAFNLNELADANNYYFDNIKFEIYKFGTTAEFSSDIILVDFGFDTNIPELVKASGQPRLFFPSNCASVKVNGKEAEIESIEGFADGRFYIFMMEEMNNDDEVVVTFNNPADAAFHLIYASGANQGEEVPDFNGTAENNNELQLAPDALAWPYVAPTVIMADPENGSFNLPNSIKDFKLKFDKKADCARIVATLNGKAMTITPAEGFAEEIVMTREGSDDLPTGEYTISVKNIYPEKDDADLSTDTTYVVSIGKVEYDPTDVAKELLPAEYFANCNENDIPEGFIVKFGQEERLAGQGGYGSGARMFNFAAGGDFTKGLYFREGYVEYGRLEGYALPLVAGKKYKIHFNTAMWKDNGNKTRFEIFNAAEEVVYVQVIDNKPNMDGNKGVVNGSASTDITFVPEVDGNYIIRWTSSDSETGDPQYKEILLGNPSFKYTPSQIGYEETQKLADALENAKKVAEENSAERYDGAALDALNAAIAKYEAEKEGYTNPSQYTNAAEELNTLAQAQKDHRQLCDNYDSYIKKAIDVVRQNADKKFASTELYAELSAIVAKYNGSSEWKNVADTITDPTAEEWQLFYTYDELKDETAINAAITELKDISNTTSLLFTEGESTCSSTGVKVAVERLRLGAEDLKALGVPEDDELIVAANNALTDDDELAEAIKIRITGILYEALKDPENKLFETVVDEETLEETTPSYDMTVFVKNPNVYKQAAGSNFTDESVPGWIVPEGFSRPGLSCGWGAFQGTDVIAEDCMFQTWGGSYRVEQTITDLPAGIYTIKIGFGERMQDDASSNMENSFTYAKTSATPAVEEGMEEDRTLNFAGTFDCPGIGQTFPKANTAIENIVVTDGLLTIGANASQGSHTFFNDVRLLITKPATDFNYENAYNQYLTGVEGIESQPAKVRAIELYDLNGRRITSARQGIVIVKKYMSDGTLRTEKVIKK